MAALALVQLAALQGCGVISVEPTLELFKAAGTATSYAIAGLPARAQDTISHPHERLDAVCIAWNPNVPNADMVPALQTALQQQHVSSRVFDGRASRLECPVWLHYNARFDYGVPPWGSTPQMYVLQASLSLRTYDGELLASSNYAPSGAFEMGKWVTVSDLVPPVVQALLRGTDS